MSSLGPIFLNKKKCLFICHKIMKVYFKEVYFTSEKFCPFNISNPMSFNSFDEWCNHHQKSVLRHFYAPIRSLLPFTVTPYSHLQSQASSNILPFAINSSFQDLIYEWSHTICSLWVWLLSLNLTVLRFTYDIACVFLSSILYHRNGLRPYIRPCHTWPWGWEWMCFVISSILWTSLYVPMVRFTGGFRT